MAGARPRLPLALFVLAACGDYTGSINQYCDGGFCPPDARRAPDARLTCHDPTGPQCEGDEVCLHAVCVPNTCATASPCAPDDTCNMTCVPLRDLCEGVECTENKTCVDGVCFPGCFPPSPCLGKDCGEGEFCDHGACKTLVPCAAECGEGFACHIVCTPPNDCDHVECADNEYCYKGECFVDLCYHVDCPPTQACNNSTGLCETTCDCGPAGCGTDGECIIDMCMCAPDCAGKLCGDDNGCGGECDLPCPGAQEDCADIGGGQLGCQCMPKCTNGDCGTPDGCSGFCDIEDCADSGEQCTPNGGGFACSCPVGRAECSGDCCADGSDVCRTDTQSGTGTGGVVTGAAACCNASDACTDASRNTVCCTGSGLACVDNDGDPQTEACCTVARQCNDDAAPTTNQTCCASGESCIDTADPDSDKDTCCTSAQACGEIGTCCPSGEYCSVRMGPANDKCCANNTVNCDGACVAKCPGGQTQYLCNDGIAGNEECCPSNVQRCPGAANSTGGSAFCCILPEDECFDEPDEAPICCSDPESFCTDSGACCPNAKICLADMDGNEANDFCCDTGQVDFGGVCCTPACPPSGSITCGAMDTCNYHECPGQCDANSACVPGGAGEYHCETLTCNPVCNTAACYQCVGGACDYRCDNPGYGGTICRNGQCVIP